MTFVLYFVAFLLGGLAGVWFASLATMNKIRDAEDEAYRLRARLYQLGHRA